MRIVCPSCQATYEVPEATLARGPRMVRCARCGSEWTPQPLTPPPAPPPAPLSEPRAPAPPMAKPAAPLPEPEMEAAPEPNVRQLPAAGRAEPRLSSYRPRGEAGDEDERLPPQDYESFRSNRPALIGWALSLLLLVALAWAAVTWRAQVMAAWPPSQRVYAALGLR